MERIVSLTSPRYVIQRWTDGQGATAGGLGLRRADQPEERTDGKWGVCRCGLAVQKGKKMRRQTTRVL